MISECAVDVAKKTNWSQEELVKKILEMESYYQSSSVQIESLLGVRPMDARTAFLLGMKTAADAISSPKHLEGKDLDDFMKALRLKHLFSVLKILQDSPGCRSSIVFGIEGGTEELTAACATGALSLGPPFF